MTDTERAREVAAARDAALEEAAGVADGVAIEGLIGADDVWIVNYVADRIRARKSNPQPAGGGGPTTPTQDTEERT